MAIRSIAAISLFVLTFSAAAFDGEDAYGPGVHADKTGRAFTFEDDAGNTARNGRIRLNLFGPDRHADEAGRPVEAKPLDGEDDAPLLLDWWNE